MNFAPAKKTAVLPFEVVRRRGVFFARANGLAKIFPERFDSTRTGDYLVAKDRRYGCGSYRQQEAAIAFERFIRSRFQVRTRLCRTSDPHASRVDWILSIRLP